MRDCSVVYRNTSHVRCQCHRLGTFGVLMDSSQREVMYMCTHTHKHTYTHRTKNDQENIDCHITEKLFFIRNIHIFQESNTT